MDIMTIRAPEELRNELNRIAKKHGLTRNALVINILSLIKDKNILMRQK